MEQSLAITINGSNDAPVVANNLADQSVNEDANFLYIVPSNAFTDIDGSDSLTYSASLVDGGALSGTWLSFDDSSRTFSGTPLNGDVGDKNVRVVANDSCLAPYIRPLIFGFSNRVSGTGGFMFRAW